MESRGSFVTILAFEFFCFASAPAFGCICWILCARIQNSVDLKWSETFLYLLDQEVFVSLVSKRFSYLDLGSKWFSYLFVFRIFTKWRERLSSNRRRKSREPHNMGSTESPSPLSSDQYLSSTSPATINRTAEYS
jgi:hypothetical protein